MSLESGNLWIPAKTSLLSEECYTRATNITALTTVSIGCSSSHLQTLKQKTMSELRRFKQVDVFSSVPLKGNPLAVVMDADGLSDSQMQAIARWTNLSETTFVLPASEPHADYHVKIYTRISELPFAGHPTLGTAHALLENGLTPKVPGTLVQQCGVGNVAISISADGLLAFKAPEAKISPLAASDYSLFEAAVGKDIEAGKSFLVDMGIRWLMVEMPSVDVCLNLKPDGSKLSDLVGRCRVTGVAFYGRQSPASELDFEMRALVVEHGRVVEDPVTGSANACLARLLLHQNFVGYSAFSKGYNVRQGTCIQRDGRINVSYLNGEPWIGGHSSTIISGMITF